MTESRKNEEESRDLRIRAAVRLFAGFRRLLRALPEGPALRLARLIGRLVGRTVRREQRIALTQLRYAFPKGDPRRPDTSPENSLKALLDDVFEHYGMSVLEVFTMDRLFQPVGHESAERRCPKFERISSTGQDQVFEILDRGKGAIALSGHIGSIELLAAYYVKCGVPLSVIGRVPNYPWLAEAIEEIRRGYGAQTIWRDDPRAPRKLLRALKSGGFIAALIDQDTRLENAFAPFFGLPAAIPVALIRMAIQNQVPILSSFIYRVGPYQHAIETDEIVYDPADSQAMDKILAQFSSRLESLVRRYPEQWPWWHRRWRRRPGIDYEKEPQALRSTAQYLEWLESLTEQRKPDA